jgi:hypothetical protein
MSVRPQTGEPNLLDVLMKGHDPGSIYIDDDLAARQRLRVLAALRTPSVMH